MNSDCPVCAGYPPSVQHRIDAAGHQYHRVAALLRMPIGAPTPVEQPVAARSAR